MIDRGYWEEDNNIEVKIDDKTFCQGQIKDLPLVK